MNYTAIDKQISKLKTGNNYNLDVYLYALIKSTRNYQDNTSHVTEKKLSQLSGISEDTISKSIMRLKDYPELLSIDTVYLTSVKKKNYYRFPHKSDNYFFIRNDFLYAKTLSAKQKGFLLLLKANCLNDTNKILTKNGQHDKANLKQLSSMLHQSEKTVKRLLHECVELEQIKAINNGYLILNECFLLTLGGNDWRKQRRDSVYNELYSFCLRKGAIPPERGNIVERSLDYIADRYANIPASELFHEDGTPANSLPAVLEKRCKTLPESLTVDYFLKALDIKKPKPLAKVRIIL